MVQSYATADPALHSPELLKELIASLRPRQVPTTAAPVDVAAPAQTASSSHPFVDAMRAQSPVLQVNRPTLHATPSTENLTLTENGGITLLSTKSFTLDLYLELGTASKSDLRSLLDPAWEADPLETVKIGFSTRSIGRGKGSKEGFVRLLSYLREFHPQTLLNNLDQLVAPLDAIPQKRKAVEEAAAEDEDLCDVDEKEEDSELTPRNARSHGSYKDLLDIVVLSTLPAKDSPVGSELYVEGDFSRVPGYDVDPSSPYYVTRHAQKKQKTSHTQSTSSVATPSLTELSLNDEDPFNRALRLRVVTIFGEALKRDLKNLRDGQALVASGQVDDGKKLLSKISLAAKWAPTQGNFHDKITSIASSIAEYLTPEALDSSRSDPSFTKCLMRYRKDYLVPLRAHLEIVERKMSANDWENIKYNRIPSEAMKLNKKHFIKHDATGFRKYLTDVATGKQSISGAASTPASLLQGAIRPAHTVEGEMEAEVANAQFNTLVQSIKDSGTLSECIGMADVSGSMTQLLKDGTTPLLSSISLSILISMVTAAPFNDSIISFTDVPAFIDLDPRHSLLEKYNDIIRRGMGLSTDFIAAFTLILKKAIKAKLAPEQMVKKIFVFSDMQFDQSDRKAGEYDTHYDLIERDFTKAGYQIPQLIFWNLAGDSAYGMRTSKPVDKSRKGCAMVSGYSAATLKVFLEGGDFEEEDEKEWEEVNEEGEVVKKPKSEITPEMIMRKALAHPSFDGLKVYD